MRIFFIAFTLLLMVHFGGLQASNLGDNYIEEYKKFYPSKALAMGIQSAIFGFEDLSKEGIENWITYNEAVLDSLKNPNCDFVISNKIDARLLRLQVEKELDKWREKEQHKTNLSLYSRLIRNAVVALLESDFLTKAEQFHLLQDRLQSVINICESAIGSLTEVPKKDLERGLANLKSAKESHRKEIGKFINEISDMQKAEHLSRQLHSAQTKIQSLINFVVEDLLPDAQAASVDIGLDEYARQLRQYTDSDLSPTELERLAFQEIKDTKSLMTDVSKSYLKNQYPKLDLPKEQDEIIKLALGDMEKDVPLNGEDYLSFWLELRDASIEFIEQNNIVTLPEFQTLRIMPAPESAGPAARVGWVASARPFDPNPITTLFLPSIPDTLDVQEQIDFWASFNKPFNRMIVIHELFPGHYTQNKIIRETPHHIRLFFPYSLYSEGYATFTERVLLDAGWEAENPLTFLAHLRKRLENANRAYTSKKLHCDAWTADQIMTFSTQTSLVAPQFAKSLFRRISQNPMQMISYFLGGQQFAILWDKEKKRLAKDFVLKDFMDTILKTGPIPIDEFATIFEENFPKR